MRAVNQIMQTGKDGEERWQTIGECFFLICQKMKDGEEGWQIVGVALRCKFFCKMTL
jgi:hypothetical protein